MMNPETFLAICFVTLAVVLIGAVAALYKQGKQARATTASVVGRQATIQPGSTPNYVRVVLDDGRSFDWYPGAWPLSDFSTTEKQSSD